MFEMLKKEKGVASILLALGMAAIMGFSAIVVDAGVLLLEKAELTRAVEAAALAGVRELPADVESAETTAKNYAQLNGIPGEKVQVFFNTDNTEITVKAALEKSLYFARFLGITKKAVGSTAGAMIGPVSSVRGAVPLAIEDMNLEYGVTYTLKEGAQGGRTGNYGALALGGSGSSNYRENLKKGYTGLLEVGDEVPTETGNMAGPTLDGISYRICQCENPHCSFENFEPGCPRIVIIPIVDGFEQGRCEVQILGFAAFYLEDVVYEEGHTDITGRFIRYIVDGDIQGGASDYGAYGIKLIR